MRIKDAILVSTLCLGLGACSISIDGEDGHYSPSRHDWDGGRATVKLPDGDRVSFGCPEGTSLFIRDNTGKGGELVYGCCTGRGADVDVNID